MSLQKYIYACTPIRAIDGDTVEVDIDLGWEIHKILHVRMNGVNAPEKNTLNGPLATKYFHDQLFHDNMALPCTLKSDVYDKYGRTVGHLWYTNTPSMTKESSINAQLEKYYVETSISTVFKAPHTA